MNYKELIHLLNLTNGVSFNEFIEWAQYPEYEKDNNVPEDEWFYSPETMSQIGEVNLVHNKQYNDIWKYVFYFKKHDIYLSIDCSYDSYEGIDYSCPHFYESRPKEVTVTVYNKI